MNFRWIFCAVLLDLFLGDPEWLPHPVRWMGRCINTLELVLRRTPIPALLAGSILTVSVTALFAVGSWGILSLCGRLSPYLAVAIQIWFGSQLLAAKSLQKESMAVYSYLKAGNLPEARIQVGRIVGRETRVLDTTGVIRAAVETVAENTSDGIVAPLFWMLIGGLPLGMAYKAINTLDSMIGYRNERYLDFGRFAARLDDVVNWIPARLSGLLMCFGAMLLPDFHASNAFRIFFRDRMKHDSPNSAQTEAACAGALGVQLGGYAVYSGKLVHRPELGDAMRPLQIEDIPRSVQLMYAVLAFTLFGVMAVHAIYFGILNSSFI